MSFCDFCNLSTEEDEELEPIYVGSPPEPKPVHLSATASKPRNDYHLLEKSVAVYEAMEKALRNSDHVALSTAEHTLEPRATHEKPFEQGIKGDVSFDDTVNYDEAGVKMALKPRRTEPKPDARVCRDCAEMFRTL
jgi:hypothetical protein